MERIHSFGGLIHRNGALRPDNFKNILYTSFNHDDNIKEVIQNLFSTLNDITYCDVMLRPAGGGASSIAHIYRSSETIGFARVNNHQSNDYVGKLNGVVWKWDSYATKGDLPTVRIADLNSATSNGIYYAASNTSNIPKSDGIFLVYVASIDANNVSQIAVGLNLTGNAYVRVLRNGTWNQWRHFAFT